LPEKPQGLFSSKQARLRSGVTGAMEVGTFTVQGNVSARELYNQGQKIEGEIICSCMSFCNCVYVSEELLGDGGKLDQQASVITPGLDARLQKSKV
jgi:hypothetical protein